MRSPFKTASGGKPVLQRNSDGTVTVISPADPNAFQYRVNAGPWLSFKGKPPFVVSAGVADTVVARKTGAPAQTDDHTRLSVSGTPDLVKIALNAPTTATGAPVVTSLTVDGVDRLGDIVAASPNLATTFTYPRAVNNGGELAQVTADTLVPDDWYKIDYEITEIGEGDNPRFGSDSPFFHGQGSPRNDLPNELGPQSYYAQVRKGFVGSGPVELIRNSMGRMTVANVAIYKVEWDLDLSGSHEFAEITDPGKVVGGNSATITKITDSGTIVQGDEYRLTYQIIDAKNVTSFFVPDQDSPFDYERLPSEPGTYVVDLIADEQVNVRTALMRLTGEITFGFVSLRKVGEGREIKVEVQVGETTHAATIHAPLAGVWHVSGEGNDDQGTGAPEAPLRQPEAAMKHAAVADTVYLRPGKYRGFSITQSGRSETERFRVITLPGEEFLATVTSVPLDEARATGNYSGIEIPRQNHVQVAGFIVEKTWREGILIRGQEPVDDNGQRPPVYTDFDVGGCVIRETGSSGIMACGFYPARINGQFNPTPTVQPRLSGINFHDLDVSNTNVANEFTKDFRNAFEEPGGNNECITICCAVDGFTVVDNLVRQSAQYGIDAKHGVSNGLIEGNTIVSVDNHGIYLDTERHHVWNITVRNNIMVDCGNGGAAVREAGEDKDQEDIVNPTPQTMSIRNVDIYNNLIINSRRDGFALIAHPGDFPLGEIVNLRFRYNTIINSGQQPDEHYRMDLRLSGWSQPEWIAAGIVSGLEVIGNVIYRDTNLRPEAEYQNTRVLDNFSGKPGFTIEENFNMTGSVDPMFVDHNVPVVIGSGDYMPTVTLPDLALRSGSPALAMVNGRSEAPFNLDFAGTTRPDPAAAGAYHTNSLHVPVALLPHRLLNESGANTITAADGLRVSINNGPWQTLPDAGLTISQSADGVLTVSGFSAGDTKRFHYEQEWPGEPYSAVGAVDALYVAGTATPSPALTGFPGMTLTPTKHDQPVVAS